MFDQWKLIEWMVHHTEHYWQLLVKSQWSCTQCIYMCYCWLYMQVYIHTLEDLAWFVIMLLSKFFNQFVHFLSLQEMIEKFNPYFLVMNIFLLCVYTSEPSHRWFYLLLFDPILLWKRILMSFKSILLDFLQYVTSVSC